ncbi:MAG: MotA/TolQ/ExbB proton channel family protein [Phycisphaerae bacterium]|nr:MotA/TolQ/ExbB proton channel family protein [Phycisphaerae bacterium]
MFRKIIFIGIMFGLFFLGCSAWGQDGQEVTMPGTETGEISLWKTIADGGIIGYFILLMSLVSVAFIIEHFLSIRREKLLPGQLAAALEEQINAGQHDQAIQLCEENGSYLGEVVGAGMRQVGAMFGYYDMQNAMQEASERAVSKMHRKLEALTFIASAAPMLGLLGTVTGMIRSFNEIAITHGTVRHKELAGGISEALVTTCLGLIVAIPTMFFVSFFRNRIEGYVAEAETLVEKLMGRFRREKNG